MVAKTKSKYVPCNECGSQIKRSVPLDRERKFFCGHQCKAEFQKRAKLLSRYELFDLYINQGLDCSQIGGMVGRDPKSIWNWLKDYGIETRPRGSDERQQFGKGKPHSSGWNHTEETKEKLRQARIADGATCLFLPNGDHVLKGRCGSDHPSWKGGSTPERQYFYASDEWKDACVHVWHRADAKCERCGLDHRDIDRQTFKFHVHHVYSFTTYPEHRSDVDNLMLLCETCHRWVHGRENADRLYIKEK